MSMLRRAARRRAKGEPADGAQPCVEALHSTAWRPCTAQHSPADTALRTLHSTADTARHCTARHSGHCPCATNNGDSSRPPCLSAGSLLARLASQQALPPVLFLPPVRLASLQGSLFAAFSVPVVRGRVQCARACFASFPPRLCLSASLVASLHASLCRFLRSSPLF